MRLLPAAAVAAGYYVGALIGFWLRFPSSGISFFWPPTAVLTAALMLSAPRTWGPLLAGAFAGHAAAHAQNGVPVAAWPIQFLANAVQAMLAAYLVRRHSELPPLFGNLQRAVTFIVGACVVAPSVASLIPASLYVNLGWAPDFANAWKARTVSNAIAALTLVPPIVTIWPYLSSKATLPSARRVTEFGLLLAGVLAAHAAARAIDQTNTLTLLLALYAPAPFLLWATVRFGGAGLSCVVLCTTLLTISSALRGEGAFASGTPVDSVVGLQLFIAVTAVPLMLMAGLLEQNRSEHRALVEMEHQNSATLRALPDLLFVQTRDGVYLHYYARSTSELLAPADTFLGKNMREILPPDMAETFAQAFKTVTPDEPSVVEYSLSLNDELRHYEARLIGLDGDRVLSVVRDITERRRSEDALRESRQRYALATAEGGIGVWDVDMGTGAVNVEGGLAALLGYKEDEIGSQLSDWERLLSPTDVEEVHARLMAYASGASPGFEAEYRMMCKDGSVRWILSRGALVDRVGGAATRVTGTYADITGRKNAEDALKEANDALVRMGRITALAELSASLAHELNQPLTAIATNASACIRWLDASAADADFRGALRDVVTDSHRASQIIRRTKEMFTNRSVQKTTLDVNGLIRDVLELARARLREGNVHVDVDLDERLPAVEADSVQIQQVVLNLVLNAVDAMADVADRPRVLRIKSRRWTDGVFVAVRDTGPGIDSPDAERIFDPFYTTKADGIGMGLTISRSIVDAHGGSMWAVTNNDVGATVGFTIPAPEQPRLETPGSKDIVRAPTPS
jgi:PAS domain S-box-containing protein